MEVVVLPTGTLRCAKHQLDHHCQHTNAQARCPSYHPTTSDTALKAKHSHKLCWEKALRIAAYKEKWQIERNLPHLKHTRGNIIANKERIHLRCNHLAVGILNFDIGNIDMYSRYTCSIESQGIVEHNRSTTDQLPQWVTTEKQQPSVYKSENNWLVTRDSQTHARTSEQELHATVILGNSGVTKQSASKPLLQCSYIDIH